MPKNFRLLLLFLFILAILFALAASLYRLYSPTVASLFLQNDTGVLAKRKEFLTRVYPIIPITQVKDQGGIKVVNLDTYQEEGPYIEVRNCVPFPYIKLTKFEDGVTFVNSGNQRLTIKLLGKKIVLAPWKRQSVPLNIPALPALYEYYCDNAYNPVGFLYVVK